MGDLSSDIRKRLISKGASLVGFSNLSEIPNEHKRSFNYGISIVVALKPKVVSRLNDGPTIEYYKEYLKVNELLDELSLYAARYIEDCGYKAFPMTNNHIVEDERTRRTILPHKTLATRSGIGWIGKCALLVTEEYGSAVRLSSVLTNAVLEVGTPNNSSRCGACEECKKGCPANAVEGINWEVGIDRDNFFNYIDCRKTARERAAKISINASICGKCIYVCPWTQHYFSKSN